MAEFTYKGKKYPSRSAFLRTLGHNPKAIDMRMRRGKTFEEAIAILPSTKRKGTKLVVSDEATKLKYALEEGLYEIGVPQDKMELFDAITAFKLKVTEEGWHITFCDKEGNYHSLGRKVT